MGHAHSHSSLSWTINCIEQHDMDQYQYEEEDSENVQIVWEFQRYREGLGWGAGPNFFSDDPGRFSSFDRKVFGNTLQSVAPPIPEGYCVDLSWSVVFHKKVSKHKQGIGCIDETSITDRFGWNYAKSFYSEKWSEFHERGLDVRRRSWRRILSRNQENSQSIS